MTDAARFKELDYVAGESRRRWLARHGVAAGNVDPTCVPFYLLVVGCPAKIPFGFCRELSVEYAVGLLSFDTPAEYAAYAASVVAAESNELEPRPRQVTFFSPRHPFDPATQLSADQLVKPLAEGTLAGRVRCSFESISGDAATHEALAGVLARKDATAPGAPVHREPRDGLPRRPRRPAHAAGRARLPGLGRPEGGLDRARPVLRRRRRARRRRRRGPVRLRLRVLRRRHARARPVLAHARRASRRSSPRLRSRPRCRSGCSRIRAAARSAASAHVERAWGDSIVEAGAGPQLIPFENAIGNVLAGKPIGLALKDFNERFAALSVSLAGLLEQIGDGMIVPDRQLAKAWIQRNDAEGYALFGDPAARLRLEQAA